MASIGVDMSYDEPFELFVPGRLCILGEHTDWAAQYRSSNTNIPAGFTLVCATNQGLHARARKLATGTAELIYTYVKDGIESSFQWPLDANNLTESAKDGSFFSYVAGTAAVVIQHPNFLNKAVETGAQQTMQGMEIRNYKTTLPMKKGLSSSAAVCVLVATAFNMVFDLGFSQEELMEIAFQGEMLTPSRCGRMDQCVVMGPGAVGIMQFPGSTCSLRKLTLGGDTRAVEEGSERKCSGLYFVVVDLKAGKDTVTILRELNHCFPFPQNDTQALAHNYVRAIEAIAADAVTAIERGDAAALGRQMTLAQEAFDAGCMPNCPAQLASPRLHALMTDPELRGMCLAVKGVGSQGDGSAQVLCDCPEKQEQVLEHIRKEYGMDGFFLNIL